MSETNYAVAPGEYLAEWMLENPEYSLEDIADRLNWSEKKIAFFLIGELRLNDLGSIRLHVLTGIPARTWMSHEMQYNKDLARLYKND